MTVFALFVALMGAIGFAGWVGNIVQLVSMVSDPITAMFVLKCVGVFFAPLGSILGVIGFF